jgi:hypothetical protein
LLGRSLYYVDDGAAVEDVMSTEPDGAPRHTGDASAMPPSHTTDGGGSDPDDAPTGTDASVKKDAAAEAGPNPTCMGGTLEKEPNDTVALASPLAIGKTCGNLSLGDTDWFTYDVGQVGNLRLTFDADGDARLLIQSAGGGVALATGSGGAFNFQTTGVWNLRVVSDTGRVQGYTLNRPAP